MNEAENSDKVSFIFQYKEKLGRAGVAKTEGTEMSIQPDNLKIDKARGVTTLQATMVHEFGHAYANFKYRNREFAEIQGPSNAVQAENAYRKIMHYCPITGGHGGDTPLHCP